MLLIAVFSYYNLASHLAPEQPVYGLQPQGLDENRFLTLELRIWQLNISEKYVLSSHRVLIF
jgi:hypothetical protein